jgi:integrase
VGRPPLPLGTHGRIRVYRLGPKRYRARTQVRDHDGVIRDVERTAKSAAAAENLLRVALRDRNRAVRDGDITGELTVRALGELWLAEIDRLVLRGKRSPTTAQAYRYRFDRHIRDGIGALRIRELSVSRLDRVVMQVQDHYGVAAAKTTRTVLSGMVGLAVRYDALERNPVREVGRIESEKSSARALSVAEAIDLRAKIHANRRCRRWDLVDVTDFMLATGLRIGEASAVRWDDVDFDAGTVAVQGTVVRVKGAGLVIKPPKSSSGRRVLELPGWAVAMLRRRCDQSLPNEWCVVFTAPGGGCATRRTPRPTSGSCSRRLAMAG